MNDQEGSRVLHVAIREVEPGVFKAEYPGTIGRTEGGPELHMDSHIATDPDSVRTWVETMAKDHGYDKVIWDKG